jgi:hypothetical protein
MLTYRVRPRALVFNSGLDFQFPTWAEVSFTFAPKQAFGAQPDGGRTAVRNVSAKLNFNRSTGQYNVVSDSPLLPLDLLLEEDGLKLSVSGEKVTVSKVVSSKNDLANMIEAVYYVLPLLLAVEFADPPIIEEINGTIEGIEFSWFLLEWKLNFITTTQEKQNDRLKQAWRRFLNLLNDSNMRVVAALQYFHVATRLERVSISPGEFLSEALLNYSKVLEVLFSPSTDVVREQLKGLGFSSDEVERDFIPVMILRSKFDVAHVSLALFNESQLSALHRYADRAETAFRNMLSRVLKKMDEGKLSLPDYELHNADDETSSIISRISNALDTLNDRK